MSPFESETPMRKQKSFLVLNKSAPARWLVLLEGSNVVNNSSSFFFSLPTSFGLSISLPALNATQLSDEFG